MSCHPQEKMDFVQGTLNTKSCLDVFLLCFACFKILHIQGKPSVCHLAIFLVQTQSTVAGRVS